MPKSSRSNQPPAQPDPNPARAASTMPNDGAVSNDLNRDGVRDGDTFVDRNRDGVRDGDDTAVGRDRMRDALTDRNRRDGVRDGDAFVDRDQDGVRDRDERAVTTLEITIDPDGGAEQQPIMITGVGFGDAAGTVRLNEVPAPVVAWSDSAISTTVPYGATTGDLVVTTAAGRRSEAVEFTVTPGVWTPDGVKDA